MPSLPGAGHDHVWLLLALAAVLAVVAATASAATWRRLRHGTAFVGGLLLGGIGLIGLMAAALLVFGGPSLAQQGWQGFRDAVPSRPGTVPMPNIIHPSSPVVPRTVPSGGRLDGRVTHVRDGDTIVVEKTPIRFEGIDCAEKGTRRGDRATEAMRRLAAGQTVQCRLAGRRSFDREIGNCTLLDGRDLGKEMVAAGLCVPRR